MDREHHYVDGAWTLSKGDLQVVVNPSTEQPLAQVRLGTVDEVDRAVGAARRALKEWSSLTPAERGEFVTALRDGLTARMGDVASLIADEVGSPLQFAMLAQAAGPIAVADSYVAIAKDFAVETASGNRLVRNEPVGVAAAITPWNYPLHQIICKLAPALVAGCTMVWKPTEVAPLTAYLLAEILDEIGLPPGVFNFVPGTGAEVGEALASHPGIDLVSFTGSTRAGTRVAALAAPNVTRVALELGGKSALVVLDDANLESAVQTGVSACYLNTGQTCAAWSRLVVPRAMVDEATEMAKAVAESMKVGPAKGDGTVIGPLVSSVQRDRVREHIGRAIAEGATVVTGGAGTPSGLDEGYFVQPTVFGDVVPETSIAQEEVFGPVLAVMAHDGDDHAVEVANATRYGLHGGVYSADRDRALAVARGMRTGTVDINGIKPNLSGPFGGFGHSGIGRELGTFGLDEYCEIKGINQ